MVDLVVPLQVLGQVGEEAEPSSRVLGAFGAEDGLCQLGGILLVRGLHRGAFPKLPAVLRQSGGMNFPAVVH